MPYFTITDFAAGLDLRRHSLTAPAGTLRKMVNCHVTPGGEIEKRFAFVKINTMPSDTRGIVELNGKLYTFRATPGAPSIADPGSPWGVGVLGQNIASIYDIIDWDVYSNKIFVTLWTDAAGNVARLYDCSPISMKNSSGVQDPHGFFCRTYKTKVFMVEGSVLYFSAVGEPGKFDLDGTATGAGFIDLSLEDSEMVDCRALEVYYDKLAVMSKTATQLWQIDPDPLKNQYTQTLRAAGTMAWRSVLQYGSGDVLYLAPDGIRSLRARNSSLAASVSDVGSPLDPVMQNLFRTNGEEWLKTTIAILQPVTGRFWIILRDRIYVLSAFPGPKITAWSEYQPVDQNGTPFQITHACTHLNTIVLRDANHNIYAYGGTHGDADTPEGIYDASTVTLEFPFHAGENPATKKKYTGIDAAATGVWNVYAAYSPDSPDTEDYIGQIIGPSFGQGRLAMEGESTHMSLRLRAAQSGPMLLSNLIIHYKLGEAT
jgi:hypothetical protein